MAHAIKPLGEVWMELKNLYQFNRLMTLAGLSHRDLAELVGYGKSHSYIGRLSRGQIKTVTPERAAKICLALECTMDELFVPRAANIPVRNGQSKVAA